VRYRNASKMFKITFNEDLQIIWGLFKRFVQRHLNFDKVTEREHLLLRTPVAVNKVSTLNFKGIMVPLDATLVDSTKLRVPILRVGTLKTKDSHPYLRRVGYPKK